jgi:serine protease Do
MRRDSESYQAGLRPGDVIVEFNKQAVEDPSQFFRLVADARVGSTASIRVLRDGRPMDFKVPIVSSSASSARVAR